MFDRSDGLDELEKKKNTEEDTSQGENRHKPKGMSVTAPKNT